MQYKPLLSSKKTYIIFFLMLFPILIFIIDLFSQNFYIFNDIEKIFSPFLSNNQHSIRYVISAIIQSVATILTLILSIPLIIIQSMYKYSKITHFFINRKEIIQICMFMFYILIYSGFILYILDDNISDNFSFYTFYSLFLFIALLVFIFDYWKFCSKIVSPKEFLKIIQDEKIDGDEIITEIIKKGMNEKNLEIVKNGILLLNNSFQELYEGK